MVTFFLVLWPRTLRRRFSTRVLTLNVMKNEFDSLVFPKSISDERKQELKVGIIRFEEKREGQLEQTSGITETGFDREKLELWIGTAKRVFDKIGFPEARLPDAGEIKFYKSDNPSLKNTIVGGVDDLRRKMAFVFGGGVDVNNEQGENNFRRVFCHELGHYPQEALAGEPQSENAPVSSLAVGFDATKEEKEANGYRFAVRKGVLAEPLAELFSYFCSAEMGVPVHKLDIYQREVSFVLSLLDKMASINGSLLKDEFGKLYKAFSTRDFSWYKHLFSTFNKRFLSLGLKEEEAKAATVDFVRSLNGIVSTEGLDKLSSAEGRTRWGYQLSEVAKKGDFFDGYEANCNRLVGHEGFIGIKGLPTQLH